ncbi:rCG47498 [Rattus norvegicus]|uniref:RCG47498 n=1 Tax=Rattus norvegicus TaxID=10116 RepID=A6HXD2_RAT|nr:rCG47498 [Rattus norvegicus]
MTEEDTQYLLHSECVPKARAMLNGSVSPGFSFSLRTVGLTVPAEVVL